MIRLALPKAEVEFEIVEPWDPRVDVFALEDLGQVLIVFSEQVWSGGIVEGHEDGVIGNPYIAVDSPEDGGSEVAGIPGGKGIAEALAELVACGLGNESRGHLAEANIEVHGAGALPAEVLIGIEELLDMPALRIMDGQVDDFVAITSGEECLMVEVGGAFPGPLDQLAVSRFGVLLEVKGAMSGSPSRPPGLELLLRDGRERSGQAFGVAHGY
jgi:hypothetical protein